MKIPSDIPVPELEPKSNRVEQTGKVGGVDATRPPVATPAINKDPVDLSERAQELVRLNKESQKVLEARSEKVEGIRKAVEEGSYSVSGESVAESILRGLLTDRSV